MIDELTKNAQELEKFLSGNPDYQKIVFELISERNWYKARTEDLDNYIKEIK